MFERFTERARGVITLAQEEARGLKHNYIGTEHVLLGLLREEEGVAARVLATLGVTAEDARAQVVRIVGPGEEALSQPLPFTPRAKRVCESALREALSLGHNYIGTEHILLGLVRENEGVATRILSHLDDASEKIRNEVARSLFGPKRVFDERVGRVVSVDDLRPLLGRHIRGRAHGGPVGEFGGEPFEGKLVGIADKPQAIIEDPYGQQYYTIETITDLEVETWVRP